MRVDTELPGESGGRDGTLLLEPDTESSVPRSPSTVAMLVSASPSDRSVQPSKLFQ